VPPRKGVVLALDCATVTGYATDSDRPGIPQTGHFDCSPSTGSKADGRDYGRLFASFESRLVGLIVGIRPETIVFEGPMSVFDQTARIRKFQSNTSAVRILYGLVALTECLASRYGVNYFECGAQDIKRHFAGSSRATKEDMLARCRQLRWPAQTDDEADAAALWSLAKSLTDPHWNYAVGSLFDPAWS
jgi:hypothetical protein